MKKNYFSCCYLFKFLKRCCTPLVLMLFFVGLTSVSAQKMQRKYIDPIVCPAKFDDAHSRMGMQQLKSKKMHRIHSARTSAGAITNANATADILITFGPGAQNNPEVQAAFQFAIDIWAEEIVSLEPIRISADFADLGQGVLASAGPTTLISNFPGAPQQNIFYPIALANSLAGEDLAPDLEFDLVVNIGNGIPWYFGTDGNTPAGQFDFVTVALHEMGHGLGFIDGGNVNNATGVGNINGGGNPFIFDTFIVDSQGNSVLDFPNPSVELGDFLTSGDVFVNGQFAVAALGGVLPELFAPNPFQGGSSIAHWDEATFPAGDPNSLMTPQAAPSESNFDVGDITRGHFRDMGWQLAEQAPFNVTPNIFNVELNVEETDTREVTVTNISENQLNLSTIIVESAQIVRSTTPEEFVLNAGESTTITLNLSTEGVLAGLSEETVTFTAEGSDVSETVTLNFRVLDGTEAPIIVINPDSFNETIEQFMVVNRPLTIDNVGNDDLNFSITVNGEAQQTFAQRAAESAAQMTKLGFSTKSYASSRANGLSSLITTSGGTFEQIATTILTEGFETFASGELNNQFGWIAVPGPSFNVSVDGAFEGTQGVRVTPDGTGAQTIALSPAIIPGSQPFMTASVQLRIEGNDTNFEFIPQSPSAGSVNTRIRFNADGSIDVLDASVGGFVTTGVTRPEGFFNVRLSVDRDDSSLRVFIDDELILSGIGFAPTIEQIVFLSDNVGANTTIDIDNIEVIDGDENAFFVSVNPIMGTVPFGGSLTANARFDARALDPGVYNATININSDDPDSPSLDIPVTLTVLSPPSISVDPDSISVSVDVEVDAPPIANASFVISNSGESSLEFTTALGSTVFTPEGTDANATIDLDMTKYGLGNPALSKMQSIKAAKSKSSLKAAIEGALVNNETFVDSIFYDSGINFPNGFGGLNNGTPIITAVGFDAVNDFTLTAVRNAYRTEGLTEVEILLEVYKGGATPADGELLLQQVTTTLSTDGIFLLEQLNTPLKFSAGERFWVVHSYPQGIDFPQGQDNSTSNVRPNTYFFSSDGGATYTNLADLVFLTRALDDGSGRFIQLSPSSGTIGSGESVQVNVSFNGEQLPNGVHETDILINSNDPLNPTVAVASSFEVSGQVSEITVSDELLLFNDVFIGNERDRTLTITNSGGNVLNISSITSDNPEFTVSPENGVIGGGESLEVIVTYAPAITGSSNGILTIASDAENTAEVEVVVNGVGVEGPFAVLDPQQNFATVPATESVDVDITLSNEGGSPLVYSFPEFTMAMALQDPNVQLQRAEVIDFSNFSREQPKGFADTRTGAPVSFSMGTDLSFGYTWIDSDEEGGPIPGFIDIIPLGALDLTPNLNDGDFADGTVSLPLPYTIPFYGEEFDTLFINANGFVSFEEPTGLTFINDQIPVDDGVNNIIAPFWADLEPGLADGGTVHVAAFTDAVVVQWTNAPGFDATGTVTFEVILFADGTIDVQYENVSSASFLANATVGIENTGGTDGAQVAFNTEYVRDNFAVRFMPPSIQGANFITAVTPLSGVLGVGQSETITVTLDAADLDVGVFLDQLSLSSNSVNLDSSTATFELTVTEGPLAVLSPELVQETVATGETVQSEITVTNAGGGTLNYSFPEFTMAMALQDPNIQLQRSEVIDFPNFSRELPKGFADTRTGAPVSFSMGTDLSFGYTWIDSDEEGGPIPNFLDIIPLGAQNLTSNLNDGDFADGTVGYTLPYAIPFYGEEFDTLFINANGFVSFEEPTGLTFINDQIPVDDGVNNIIAPFWADLEPGLADGGTVHVAAFTDAVVVQWTNAPGFDATGTVTFEVILFADGTIDIQYADVSTASFLANATVGIENTGGTDGAQVAFNTEYVRDNFAVRFMPPGPSFITGVSPSIGSLSAGQSETITVTLDAAELPSGVYLDDLVVSSNSRDLGQSITTFELTVEEALDFDNEPDPNTNLGLVDDAVLSGSVVSNGRGSLEEILYDPLIDDYFVNTQWNEYGVAFRENLGTPGPDEGFEWRVDWTSPKAINYITFGGAYPNQPQPNAQWEISYLYAGSWMTLDEGTGGWIDRGIFEWDGRSEEPIIANALRVRIFSDGENDLVSIHLRGRGGRSFGINDSETATKATLIQFLPPELNAPVADFDFVTDLLSVDFDASSSSDVGTIVEYSWDFGDGNTGSGETTSHTYAEAGNYIVTLTVTNNDGIENSTSRMLVVNDGNTNFDNEPDVNTNLGLVDDAVLSGSVTSGRGSLEEILFDPSKNNYFITTLWNEYGVNYLENLGTPGPEEGFEWRVDWTSPKAINYITFGGTYPNQPQPNAQWEISYLSGNDWVILDEGKGGWIDRGTFEWDGRSEEPLVANALRVRVFSDGQNDLISIHLRGRGGLSFGIDDTETATKATLIQFLPPEDENDASADNAVISQEESDSNGLKIYPNPTSEVAMMSFDVDTKITAIHVFDTGGRLIRVIEVDGTNKDHELYFNDMIPGTYIVKVLDDKGNTFVERVLIQR